MKYLALDIGTYSIKTVLLKFERRQFFILDTKEFVLEELKNELDPEGDITSLQRTLIENIVPEDFDGKVIYQVPNQMITSRKIELPVTQRKKAEMMVPFQLDEILPFPSFEAHYFNQSIKKENSTEILVNVTKRHEMQELFNDLESRGALPTVLTSELSVFHSHALNKNTLGPVAVLDIGHRTSKCYLIYEGQVVSHHFSFCAGGAIDEVISQTYNIPMKEAVIYKHQNCFLLTEGQYEGVTPEQKEFALLMKKTMMPLVHEVKRWLLGFRVQYGIEVEALYLTGGSTNIHNISNFFAQQVGIKTDFTTLSESLIDPEELLSGKECTYNLSTLMASNLAEKNKPGNFLTGDFSTGSNLTLPLHSVGFYLNRGIALLLVLGVLLGVDTVVQSQREKKLDLQVRRLIKQRELGLTNAEKRRWEKRMDKIAKKVRGKNRVIEQEVKTLMASSRSDGLSPLTSVFNLVSANKNLELINFESYDGKATGTFKSQDNGIINRLQGELKGSGLADLKTKVNGSQLEFAFTY
jgi:Tfp pilus assembly PilM family ATPase